MNLHDEFTRRVAADRLCGELMRAIAENDTAALERLGMRGFGRYAGRLSELMTDSVRRELLGTDDFGAIMGEVAKPAHYAHHLVNEGGSAIQQALDKRQGIRLRVVEPEFNDGRLKGIVGQIAESDSENAADNLAVQLGTMVKDMGNVFLKQNAEQRSRAGFTVTVERSGGANCCPWCADRVGRWELKNAPKDVFGVHDNCTCMVAYTNSRGVRSQRLGRSRFVEVGYQPHVNLTKDLEKNKPVRLTKSPNLEKPKRLTGGANGGIIKSIDVDDYAAVTYGKGIDPSVDKVILDTMKQCEREGGFIISEISTKITETKGQGTPVLQIEPLSFGLLKLNINAEYLSGKTLEEIDLVFANTDRTVVNSLREAVIHESGHAISIKGKTPVHVKALYRELKNMGKPGVSDIALNDGAECLAELEVLRHRGVKVSKELSDFYEKYMKRRY